MILDSRRDDGKGHIPDKAAAQAAGPGTEGRDPATVDLTSGVETVRVWIHLRYVRALIAGAALVVIMGTALVAGLQVHTDVGHMAILRYLFRSHVDGVELTALVSDPRTSHRLEDLFTDETLHNPGGFVYAVDGALVFHPHVSTVAEATRPDRSLNRSLFPQLVGPYLRGDLEALLAALRRPEVETRLVALGLDQHIDELDDMAAAARGKLARRRVLRLAVRCIQPFLPGTSEPFQLTLADKLRFYDEHAPTGTYVGLFEVRGLQPAPGAADPIAVELSRHGHFLSIYRASDQLVVEDYVRGERRTYALVPFELPNGGVGYRVALASAA